MHKDIFAPYKENLKFDTWRGFPELMWNLGYDMDMYESFEEYKKTCGIKLKEAHSKREERRNTLYLLEHADHKIVGNYLFSHWRDMTHWAESWDEYEEDYMQRVIAVLESKL